MLLKLFLIILVTMQDILNSITTTTPTTSSNNILSPYKGLALVGGFSYADVLGSAKGWAASIKFNAAVNRVFNQFRRRAGMIENVDVEEKSKCESTRWAKKHEIYLERTCSSILLSYNCV